MVLILLACGVEPNAQISSTHPQAIQKIPDAPPRPVTCPERVEMTLPIPGTPKKQLDYSYWVERWSEQFDLNRVLLDEPEINHHNLALKKELTGGKGQLDLRITLSNSELREHVTGRLKYIADLVDQGSEDDA